MNAALIPTHPNRPLVGIRIIERMLLRHVFAPVPEAKLIVAMICQAMADAISSDDYLRRRAYEFLQSRRLDFFTDLVDINPEFVRDVARRTRYLTTQKIQKPKKRIRKPGAR
ncbi:MAG: hypothetical protein M0Z83_01065 [Betaproteobacteria bacterium]|nr:hypothetical protein [Betaproteobacteria bacterium]